MKRILLSALGLLALGTVAVAQINTVPQTGITSGYLPKSTYSSAFFGLVPVVTSGTDQICIAGSATKTIRLQRLVIYATTVTGAQAISISLVRRASADTGGTAALTTANPGISTQIASRDTGQNPNTASTATLISYTAAPTIVDSAPVYLESITLSMPLGLVSTQAPGVADFNYARDIENNLQPPTLRGVAQQICVNNNVTITNASVWGGYIVWTEE